MADPAAAGRRRILLVSSTYPVDDRDWRGLFIRHIVRALARLDDIELRVWAPPGELPTGVQAHASPSEQRWLARLMQAGGIAHRFRSGGLPGKLDAVALLWHLRCAYRRPPSPDLYHVNWLQNALMLPADGRPLLLTALGTDLRLLGLPLVRRLLRRALRGRRVAICPNNDWMVAPLQQSFGDLAEVHYLPFGIDPRWYAIERAPPAGIQRWLVVSRLTRDKLGPLFEETREWFARPGRELHLFGPMQESLAIPDWVHYHGPATSDELAGEWFPGASGLLTLSRHAEGRPQVMLEAMAAGLPIVAADIPAHASLLRHGRDGLLCAPGEAAMALQSLADPDLARRIGAAARAAAAAEYGTWDDCALRYRAMHGRLLTPS